MLLDANLLLHAMHERAAQHEQAAAWITEKLGGAVRIGFPPRSRGYRSKARTAC